MNKKKMRSRVLMLLAACLLAYLPAIDASAAEVQEEENGAFNAVAIPLGGMQKDEFTSSHTYQYYRVNLEQEGKLSVSFSSSQLKSKATIWLYYNKACSVGQSKVLSYNKKKKTTKGTLTSDYIMNPGSYYIKVQLTDPNLFIGEKTAAYTINTKFEEGKFDDAEPNTLESNAQEMIPMEINKKQKIYNMHLSGNESFQDTCDTFCFTLKEKKALGFRLSFHGNAKIRVMLKQTEANGFTKIINSSKQYLESKGKKVTLNFATKKELESGKYYLSVVLLDNEGVDIPYQVSVFTYTPVNKIQLKNKTIKMKCGETEKIKYSVQTGATEPVTFQSKKPSIVTVNSSGKLTAKKEGTTSVTITSRYSKKKAVVKIKVTAIKVTSVKISKKQLILNQGMSSHLKAVIKPGNATNKNLKWSSSDSKVVNVNQKGKVTAVGIGKAVIKAAARDGSKKMAKCTVTVKKKSVTLSSYYKSLYVGNSFKLRARVDSVQKEKVSWHSTNSDIASVSNKGYVYGKYPGSVSIYAKLADGTKSRACKVVVQKRPVESDNQPNHGDQDSTDVPETPSPVISAGASSVKVGGSITLTASVSGGTWSSSGNGKVSLSASGSRCTVTGIKEGTVYISYKVNGKSAGISIYVRN